MADTKPTRLLLVEDNATTARTVTLFLAAEGYQTHHSATGEEGLHQVRAELFDLVILDLMLPDLDGLSICRTIRQSSDVPIVMLTARSTEDDIVAGLEAGADDYVCKPFGSRELLARIRSCLRRRGEAAPPRNRLSVGSLTLDLDARRVEHDGALLRLTRSEFDILAVLMRSPGRVFTRQQLIERALGPDFDGFDRTIDTHVWSLRRKLGESRSNPRYILSELGIGYRMGDQHDA